jgi:adenylate cyclase
MNMDFRLRSDNLIILTLLGALTGLLYSFAENALKDTELVPLMIRAVSCLVLIFLSIHIAAGLMKSWLKGKTFISTVLWRTAVYILIINFWLALVNGISEAYFNDISVITGAIDYLRYSDMYLANLLTIFSLLLIIISILEINTLHRKGELVRYIFGLFHKPKEVNRIFMFADMRSSTSVAEKLGNLKFGMLLQDFFSDVSDAISLTKGEVYGYVGDEIIISWKYRHAMKDNQCIRCFFGMQKAISAKADNYMKKYGVVPEIKAGMHAGKVVVMWVGEQKKEIVYLGDVLNTTSRIQSECNQLGEELLASGQVTGLLAGQEGFIARPLGEIGLRGKEEKVLLFGLKEAKSPA